MCISDNLPGAKLVSLESGSSRGQTSMLDQVCSWDCQQDFSDSLQLGFNTTHTHNFPTIHMYEK